MLGKDLLHYRLNGSLYVNLYHIFILLYNGEGLVAR
jgi:hypothetical protein